MNTVKCNECGAITSGNAAVCPYCGTKKSRKSSFLRIMFVVFLLTVIIGAFSAMKDRKKAGERIRQQGIEQEIMGGITPEQREIFEAAKSAKKRAEEARKRRQQKPESAGKEGMGGAD
jgi:hypothetical protein